MVRSVEKGKEKRMTAIETIKTLFTMKTDLVESAAKAANFTDDDALIKSVCRWAALRSGENEETVLKDAKAMAANNWGDDISTLRDILEIGLKPWKFEGCVFDSDKQYDEWKKKRVLLTIHRGAKQIGGSTAELNMGRTTVLVDFGSNLPGSKGTVSDDDIVKTIFDNHRKYADHRLSGVLFTHYHGDHTGLMEKIPEDIPIYMDEAMFKILRVLHKYTKNAQMQELLKNDGGRIHIFTQGELLNIGDINIIPFFIDHSAYHSNMFLFDGAGHTILHSGDFRATGYLKKSVNIVPKLIRENYRKEIDVLLCEGTMMTRSAKKEHLLTEWELQKEAKDFMKDHRQIFIVCSSMNFDSLTSFCQAAKANNLPIYGSAYIIEMLKTFSDMAGKKTELYNLPEIMSVGEYLKKKDGDYVVLLGSLTNRGKEKTEELYHNYGNGKSKYCPHLIYSMWQGYLNATHPAYDEGLAAFVRKFNGRVKYLHSSGHADKETLAKFIEKIAPKKYIVPFHTENQEGFKELAMDDKYKNMVILPEDGDTIEIA